MTDPDNIVVAMSGGVDSSVAAALLREQGHHVVGVTLKLLEKEMRFGCCGSTSDIDDARDVCGQLGIPHYVIDFSRIFKEKIMDPFVETYLRAETPNPCIACNRFVKFAALLERAKALGADRIATGHYARVVADHSGDQRVYRLLRATDRRKDQSYVLYNLGQDQLAHLCLPVGNKTKAEVRELARKFGLRTADKADSQEICFVPQADTAGYMKQTACSTNGSLQPGEIKDTAGRVLGKHKGIAYYTRGQREGLGISLGHPMYVVDLIAETNTVVVGQDEETLSGSCSLNDVHWTMGTPPSGAFQAAIQIRSRHEAAPGCVVLNASDVEIQFDSPQRAVTPGQSAVFYKGDEVLGGGIIKQVRVGGHHAKNNAGACLL